MIKKGEMDTIYFKDVPGIGNLYWDQLLWRYDDYDMVFICKDDNNTLYYCFCDDCLQGNYSWLITPITQEKIEDVKSHNITVLTPFKEAEHVLVANIRGFETNDPECQFNWTKYSDIDPDELPADDWVYYDYSTSIDFIISFKDKDYHG